MKANYFETLANRARGGDPTAAATLHADLQPALRCMARRALRTNGSAGAVAARLRSEVEIVRAEEPAARHDDGDSLLRRVAQRICQGVVQRLQPRPGAIVAGRETVLGV